MKNLLLVSLLVLNSIAMAQSSDQSTEPQPPWQWDNCGERLSCGGPCVGGREHPELGRYYFASVCADKRSVDDPATEDQDESGIATCTCKFDESNAEIIGMYEACKRRYEQSKLKNNPFDREAAKEGFLECIRLRKQGII